MTRGLEAAGTIAAAAARTQRGAATFINGPRAADLVVAVLGDPATAEVQNIARALTAHGALAIPMSLADVTLGQPGAAVLDAARGAGLATGRVQELLWNGAAMPQLDAAVMYHGALVPGGGLQRLRAIERAGVPVVNPAASIKASRDKWLTAERLMGAGVATPDSRLVTTGPELRAAVQEFGLPTFFKLRVGTEGKGVFRLSQEEEAVAVGETIFALRKHLVAQRPISNANGDVRAFVVDGEVVAIMRRTSNSFRNNIANGGKGTAEVLHPADAKTAIGSARALGLDVAGVDLMGDTGKMAVIEANSGPGHKIIEVTGHDVADDIARLVLRRAQESYRA